MTAKPAPRRGWEALSNPTQINQRRYEAVRAYLLEGAPLAQAAARFGYSPPRAQEAAWKSALTPR